MAHMIERMAYVGETPWHGLGSRLTPRQPVEVWAREAGMEWQILEAPVRFNADGPFPLEDIHSYDDHKVLFRSDTKAPLSVVSQRYKVVQPRDVLEFYRDLTEGAGFELETAGVLKGGKKVWALARTGQSATLRGGDVSNGYVLLATACDGTLATTAQFTCIRVVCNNTLSIALERGGEGVVKVPHSVLFDAASVKRQLGISVSVWDAFMGQLRALSERRMSPVAAEAFLRDVFTKDGRPDPTPVVDRHVGQVLSLFQGRGRGSDLPSARGTAFGLLNAVTEYVDHERRAHSVDNRLDSAWFGQGASLKQKALNHAVALLG